jgi:hypothetical protein
MDEGERAIAVVEKFLRLVEDRNLEEASPYLAPGVTITFPGDRRFTGLAEQVASSAGRFRSVQKVFEKFDAVTDDDEVIVYVFGTLRGEALDGSSFSGVRFIDRFVLAGDRIVDQKVWNDMAESKVLERRDEAE